MREHERVGERENEMLTVRRERREKVRSREGKGEVRREREKFLYRG